MRPMKPVVDQQGINFNELEQVVNKELEASAKYEREDKAKFRAVTQRVATYDEFENIVKASHLQPMKEDVTNLELKRSNWSSSGRSVSRSRKRTIGANKEIINMPTNVELKPENVTTSGQFIRCWERACKADMDKYRLLKEIGTDKLLSFCEQGVPGELLGPVFSTLYKCFQEEDSGIIEDVLTCLSKAGRLGLSIQFLSEEEKKDAIALLDKVPAAKSSWDTLL